MMDQQIQNHHGIRVVHIKTRRRDARMAIDLHLLWRRGPLSSRLYDLDERGAGASLPPTTQDDSRRIDRVTRFCEADNPVWLCV